MDYKIKSQDILFILFLIVKFLFTHFYIMNFFNFVEHIDMKEVNKYFLNLFCIFVLSGLLTLLVYDFLLHLF